MCYAVIMHRWLSGTGKWIVLILLLAITALVALLRVREIESSPNAFSDFKIGFTVNYPRTFSVSRFSDDTIALYDAKHLHGPDIRFSYKDGRSLDQEVKKVKEGLLPTLDPKNPSNVQVDPENLEIKGYPVKRIRYISDTEGVPDDFYTYRLVIHSRKGILTITYPSNEAQLEKITNSIDFHAAYFEKP
ncbi:MAG: hypothetical protein G01um1014106_698 [Parcubacteria group bacterium Gr01-1014_106]|nr:MAG: hypothetical protein G01um1014106_698 [Parcubacteria group bacterium Gr01-1014_106]